MVAAAPRLPSARSAAVQPVPFPTSNLPHVLSPEEVSVLMSDETADKFREQLAAVAAPISDEVDGFTTSSISSSSSSSSSSTAAGAAAAAACRSNVRVEWNRMTSGNKTAFINAISCLATKPSKVGQDWNPSLFGDFYYTHSLQVNWIHSVDTFLPWHRYFVYAFEKVLRTECAYRGPMPWWRETDAAGKLRQSNLFTAAHFGTLPLKTASGMGACVSDGPFKNFKVGDDCIARGANETRSALVTKAREDECQGNSKTTYRQHRLCVEGSNHGDMHMAIGPTMGDVARSPADPIFFMHHLYIDYQWKRWQKVAASRSTSIDGCYNMGFGSGQECMQLTTSHLLSVDGIIPDMTVGQILDTENSALCYTYDDLL
ncbi:tyrosinase [Microdochium nivale]|nr:tyrosinase [Microdochium nivale]